MEYLPDAKPITTYVADAELATRERVRLFLKVCDAVQHGHQRGIIHRDLKPGNILVLPTREPKIIDFGVARAIDPDVTRMTSETDSGKLVGTLRYMSPEQCDAEAGDVDVRSDVYALGVVLFEILSGQFPYDVETTTPYDIPRVIRESEPLRLSSFDPVLRGDLETIVLKALEKDRSRRYQFVDELSRDLRHFLDGEPIDAKRDRPWYVLKKTVMRHKAVVATAVSLFVVASVSAVVMTLLYRDARRQEQTARQNLELATVARERAAQEARTARKTAAFLTELFEVANPYADPADAPTTGVGVTAEEILRRGAAKLSEELVEEPEVRASLMTTIGRIYMNLGLYPEATEQLEAAIRVRERMLGPSDPGIAESLTCLAELQTIEGKPEAARRNLKRALDLLRSSGDVDQAAVALTLTTLARLEYDQGDPTAAEPLVREALEIRERVYGLTHPRVAESLNDLGLMMHATGRLEEASRLFRQAIEMQRSVLGPDHPVLAVTMQNYASVLHETKDYAQASTLFEEAIRIKRARLGENHSSVAATLNNYGALLHDMGEYERAEAKYREALRIRKAVFGETHVSVGQSLNNIGELMMITGRAEEAAPLFEQAWRIRRAKLGEEHPDTLRSFVDIGWAYWARGDLDAAEPYYRKTLEVRQRTLGPDHEHTKLVRGQLEALHRAQMSAGSP